MPCLPRRSASVRFGIMAIKRVLTAFTIRKPDAARTISQETIKTSARGGMPDRYALMRKHADDNIEYLDSLEQG